MIDFVIEETSGIELGEQRGEMSSTVPISEWRMPTCIYGPQTFLPNFFFSSRPLFFSGFVDIRKVT